MGGLTKTIFVITKIIFTIMIVSLAFLNAYSIIMIFLNSIEYGYFETSYYGLIFEESLLFLIFFAIPELVISNNGINCINRRVRSISFSCVTLIFSIIYLILFIVLKEKIDRFYAITDYLLMLVGFMALGGFCNFFVKYKIPLPTIKDYIQNNYIEVENNSPTVFCTNCGAKISETDKFCGKCGAKINR